MPWNLKETPWETPESFLLDRCYHGVHYDIVYLEPMKYWCDTSQVTLSTTQTGMSTFYDVLCTSKTGTLSNTIAFSERVARDGDLFVVPCLTNMLSWKCIAGRYQGAQKQEQSSR
jgi:hypothetical protein